MRVKLTKSQLKELIRHSISEIISEEDDVMDKTIKYKDNDGNEKEATVGGILKKGEDHPAHKQAQQMVDKGKEKKPVKKTKISADPFKKDKEDTGDDVGGPAYPNVPKGAKTSKEAIKTKQIDILNKQAEKGDGELIDTEYNGTVVWTNGNPKEDSFIATTEDGEEVEIDYADIIRFENDDEDELMFKGVMGASPDSEMNAAGEFVDPKTLAGHPDFKKESIELSNNNLLKSMIWEVIHEERKQCPTDTDYEHKGYGFYQKKGASGSAKYVRGDDCKYYSYGSPGHQKYITKMRDKRKEKEANKGSVFSKIKQGVKQGRKFAQQDKKERSKKIKKSIKKWFNNLSFLN